MQVWSCMKGTNMKSISLNGLWECSFPDGRTLEVRVPGCYDIYIEEKDLADEVIYRRKIDLEKQTGFCQLYFGGVSYYCEVFVNGQKVGIHEGIWDHFWFDISDAVREGENEIRVHVTKPGYQEEDRFPLREVLSGFIPDVLCTFGGIWDDCAIVCADDFVVRNHFAKAYADGKTEVLTELDVKNDQKLLFSLALTDPSGAVVWESEKQEFEAKKGIQSFAMQAQIANLQLWSFRDPKLYSYTVTISSRGQQETVSKTYGYREIRAEKSHIVLNGDPIYPRGLLHWGYYDDMIPNPSRETIQEEITQTKKYGFNMLKHCLYIPREEYLRAADEMGILLWIELPLWLPEVSDELEPRIRREFPAILNQIAGHPSVILISLGCELDSKVSSEILEEMYHQAKNLSSALVRDNSGSGECYDGLAVDYADFFDYHFYGELQNMENLMESFTPSWRSYRPWIYGEFCDSDTMRDLKEVRRAYGTDHLWWERDDDSRNPVSLLKPDFYAGKHDARMEKSGIRKDFDEIRKLSYDHTMVHRKTTLEQTRSFEEISGYNITSIRDVPIATSGFFDDQMQPKFDFGEMQKINADVVLLPAWDLTRIWIGADRIMSRERYNFFGGDWYSLHILASNYSKTALEQAKLCWKLTQGDTVLLSGEHRHDQPVQKGSVAEVLYVTMRLPQTERPQTCTLTVTMEAEGMQTENSWPVFLYPQPQENDVKIGLYDPANVWTTLDELYANVHRLSDEEAVEGVDLVITSCLTANIRTYAKKGGKVIYLQRGEGTLPVVSVPFWREGMVRRFEHLLLDEVKKEVWFDDLRYFSLSTDTAFDLEGVKALGYEHVTPILRRYDCRQWLASDYLAECTYGEGRMLLTTLRLEGGMGKQPLHLKNNRYARWMLDRMIRYLVDQPYLS